MSEPLILCENLVKIYKLDEIEIVALQGLDLTVQTGEVMALVGASGSGKTTLLNVLGGLDRPSAGKVIVAGNDLLKLSDAQLEPLSSPVCRLCLAAEGAQPDPVPERRAECRTADDHGGRQCA